MIFLGEIIMQMKERREFYLAAAMTGDEAALEWVLQAFNGLIWQEFQGQKMRPKPDDWYHECRLVMYRCLMKLPHQHWGVLTIYFQRALRHHVTSLWREEVQSKYGPMLSDDCLTYLPTDQAYGSNLGIEWHLLLVGAMAELSTLQYQLMTLRLQGYSIQECSVELDKSASWCYQQWRLIQHYFKSMKERPHAFN